MTGPERTVALTRGLLAFSLRQPLAPCGFHLVRLTSDTAGLLRRLIAEDVEFGFVPDSSGGPIVAEQGYAALAAATPQEALALLCGEEAPRSTSCSPTLSCPA
ncbi:MAG: hypothetical protein KKA32_00010 [Actinobacteria bacterium]|nr:hypothetical protein [Actinomycetota bacterium]